MVSAQQAGGWSDHGGAGVGQSESRKPRELDLGLELHVERGVAGLLRLHDAWNSILETLSEPRFFQTFEWQRCVTEHLDHEPDSVHFCLLKRGLTPIAIFPLRQPRLRVAGLPFRILTLPVHGHVALNDFVQRSDDLGAGSLHRLLGLLNREPAVGCDLLRLPAVPDSSCVMKALHAQPEKRSLRVRSSSSMYFECHSHAACLERMSGHFKRNLRRQRKKLEQRGRVSLTFSRDQADLVGALDDFLRLEASGWKGTSGRGTAILLDPHLRAFYQSLRDRFVTTGACQVNLLKLDGVAIAGQFCLVSGRSMNIIKIAYDEAFASEAPGSQLLEAFLQRCCEDPGIDRLSLVTGPDWGERWNPLAEDVWTIVIAGPGLRGRLGYLYHVLRGIAGRAKRRWFRTPAKSPG